MTGRRRPSRSATSPPSPWSSWTPRHTLWLVAGALVAHSLGGLVILAHTTLDQLGLGAIIALTVAGLWLLDRRLAGTPHRKAEESA